MDQNRKSFTVQKEVPTEGRISPLSGQPIHWAANSPLSELIKKRQIFQFTPQWTHENDAKISIRPSVNSWKTCWNFNSPLSELMENMLKFQFASQCTRGKDVDISFWERKRGREREREIGKKHGDFEWLSARFCFFPNPPPERSLNLSSFGP